jgi:DDE family transposase
MGEDATRAGRPRKRYRTRNWREYDRGLIARGDLTVWISPDLAWRGAEGTGQRGRPRVFGDAAIRCAPTLKVLHRLPPRAAQGMAGGLIRPAGLDWRTPHFGTPSRRQKDLTVTIPHRPRGRPPHLAIDGTGLEVPGEGEWKARRHGAGKRRVWRKAHLAIDADGHEVRAVETTGHRHGDGEVAPGLSAQVPRAERIAAVGGDGACGTRGVREAAASRQAATVVPPRRDGRPRKARTTGAAERDETLRAVRRLGRRLWRRWSGHHRRGLVETATSRLKRLGERLAARDPARQVAEVQTRCAILNTFDGLGMPEAVALA